MLNKIPQMDILFKDERLNALLQYMKGESLTIKIHEYAKQLLDDGKVMDAWQVLLHGEAAAEKIFNAI
jgi:hypothetical protein